MKVYSINKYNIFEIRAIFCPIHLISRDMSVMEYGGRDKDVQVYQAAADQTHAAGVKTWCTH